MKKYLILAIATMVLALTQCKPEALETPLSPTGEPELVYYSISKINWQRALFVQLRNTNSSTIEFCFDIEFLCDGQVIYSCHGTDANSGSREFRMGPGEKWMFYTYYYPLNFDELRIVNMSWGKVDDPVKLTLVKEEKNIGNLVLGFVTDSEIRYQAVVQVAFYWNDHLVDFVEKIFEPDDDLEAVYEVYESYDRYEIFTNAY